MQRRHVSRWAGISLLVLLALVPAGAAAEGPAPSGGGTGPSSARTVTATGVAVIPGGGATASSGPRMLDVGVRVRTQGNDIKSAAHQVKQEVDAIEAALEKVGVDPSAIRMQNFNVGPQFRPQVVYQKGAAAGPVQAIPAPQPALKQVTGFMVNENLQVTVSGLNQLASAMSAAIAAGATSVNTFTPCCVENGTPPAGSSMTTAIGQATAQAEAEAQAAAQAAGVTLGPLHALTVEPPVEQGPFGAARTPDWRVQVTVAYDVAS